MQRFFEGGHSDGCWVAYDGIVDVDIGYTVHAVAALGGVHVVSAIQFIHSINSPLHYSYCSLSYGEKLDVSLNPKSMRERERAVKRNRYFPPPSLRC